MSRTTGVAFAFLAVVLLLITVVPFGSADEPETRSTSYGEPELPTTPWTYRVENTTWYMNNSLAFNASTTLIIENSTVFYNETWEVLSFFGPVLINNSVLTINSTFELLNYTWIENCFFYFNNESSNSQLTFYTNGTMVNVTALNQDDITRYSWTLSVMVGGHLDIFDCNIYSCTRLTLNDFASLYAYRLTLDWTDYGLRTDSIYEQWADITVEECFFGFAEKYSIDVDFGTIDMINCRGNNTGMMIIDAPCNITGSYFYDGKFVLRDTSYIDNLTNEHSEAPLSVLVDSDEDVYISNLTLKHCLDGFKSGYGTKWAWLEDDGPSVFVCDSTFINCTGYGVFAEVPTRITNSTFKRIPGNSIESYQTILWADNCVVDNKDAPPPEGRSRAYSMSLYSPAGIYGYNGVTKIDRCHVSNGSKPGIVIDIPRLGSCVTNTTVTHCAYGVVQVWDVLYFYEYDDLETLYENLFITNCNVGFKLDAPSATRSSLFDPNDPTASTTPLIRNVTINGGRPVHLKNNSARMFDCDLTAGLGHTGIMLTTATLRWSERLFVHGQNNGIWVDSNSDAYVANSTFHGARSVKTEYPGEGHFLNCSIGANLDGSRIYVYYYINIHCVDINGDDLKSRVELTTHYYADLTTDDQGWIRWMPVLAKRSSLLISEEVEIEATALGVTGLTPTASRSVYPSKNMDVILTLSFFDIKGISLTSSVERPTVGMDLVLTAKFLNRGAYETGGYKVEFYEDNVLLGSVTDWTADPASEFEVTFNITANVGYHEYVGYVETGSSSKEVDKENNVVYLNLTAAELPVANISATPDEPVIGEKVFFSASNSVSDVGLSRFLFSFGDGTDSGWVTTSFVSHNYTMEGKYVCMVRVEDINGFTSQWSDPMTINVVEPPEVITPNRPPIAGFDVWPNIIDVTVDVQFYDTSSDPDGDEIDAYLWDFGDGATSTVLNPTHKYDDDGLYKVTLQVWDIYGNVSYPFVRSVSVLNLAPILGFTTSIDNTSMKAELGEAVSFDATSTTDPDDDMVDLEFEWDYGDGSNGLGSTVSHVYDEPGTYTVTLKVTDDDGANSSFSFDVVVEGETSEPMASSVLLPILVILAIIAILTAFVLVEVWRRRDKEEEEEEVPDQPEEEAFMEMYDDLPEQEEVPESSMPFVVEGTEHTEDFLADAEVSEGPAFSASLPREEMETADGDLEPDDRELESEEEEEPEKEEPEVEEVEEEGLPEEEDLEEPEVDDDLHQVEKDVYHGEEELVAEEAETLMVRDAESESTISFDTAPVAGVEDPSTWVTDEITPDTPVCIQCSKPLPRGAVFKKARVGGKMVRAGPFCSIDCYKEKFGKAKK